MTSLSDSERLLREAFEGVFIQLIKNALDAAAGDVERAADLLLTNGWLALPGVAGSDSSSKLPRATSIKAENPTEPVKYEWQKESTKTAKQVRERTPSVDNMFARSLGSQSNRASPAVTGEFDDFDVPATSSIDKSQSKRASPALVVFPKVDEALTAPPLTNRLTKSAANLLWRPMFNIKDDCSVCPSTLSPKIHSSAARASQGDAQTNSITPKSRSPNTFISQNSTPAATTPPVSIDTTSIYSFSGTSTLAPTKGNKCKLGKWDVDTESHDLSSVPSLSSATTAIPLLDHLTASLGASNPLKGNVGMSGGVGIASSYIELMKDYPMKYVVPEGAGKNIGGLSTPSAIDRSTPLTPNPLNSSSEPDLDSLGVLTNIFSTADHEESKEALRKCDGDRKRELQMLEGKQPGALLKGLLVEVSTPPKQNKGETANTQQWASTYAVGNSKTAENSESAESSSASSRDGFSNNWSEDAKEAESSDTRKQKRRASIDKEISPVKRQRRNDSAPDLEIARVWVNTNYGYISETGVAIVYHRGDEFKTHRCKFPFAIISNAFPKLNVTHVGGGSQITLAEGISCDIFNLALQWSVCRNIQLETARYPKESQQIELILCTVRFAENSGLLGFSADMAKHIKPLLIEKRSLLSPLFISAVQILPLGHPLQTLFVNAAMKSYFEHREDRNRPVIAVKKQSHDSYRDEAHRVAFEGNIWRFNKCLKKHQWFELAVLRMAQEMWWGSEVMKTPGRVRDGGGKTVTVVYDPLDGSKVML